MRNFNDVVLAIVQVLPVGYRTIFILYVFEGY
jgi:S-ribosylhomocysteine lyase LuxS involved in autoinducer biosynthesis